MTAPAVVPDPVDVAAAEAAIIERLQATVKPAAIESFPDDADQYRMTHQRAAVLVAYAGGDYGELLDTDDVVQERRMRFAITVQARSMAGHGGAYTYLEAVRAALTGYQIPGFTPIRPVRERFLGQKAGTTSYVLTVGLDTIAAQVDDGELLPILTRLTLSNDHTTSEITP